MNTSPQDHIASLRKNFENSILERNKKPISIHTLSNTYFHPADKRNPEGFRKPKNSWTLVNWVISYSSLPPSAKLVAAQIASHYNAKTGHLYPTMETISYETGLNKATVSKAVDLMVSSGEWHIEKISQKGKTKTVSFYIPRSPLETDEMYGPHWVSKYRDESYIELMKKKIQTKTQQRKNLDKRLEKDDKKSLRQLKSTETETVKSSEAEYYNYDSVDDEKYYEQNNFQQGFIDHDDPSEYYELGDERNFARFNDYAKEFDESLYYIHNEEWDEIEEYNA